MSSNWNAFATQYKTIQYQMNQNYERKDWVKRIGVAGADLLDQVL